MHTCSPKPNARCGFGRRSMRNANGSSNTASSRFADAKYSATWSPALIFTPPTSQSSVAVRVKWLIGVTQRRISSTASGSSSGWSRSFSHWSGFSQNATRPPLIALRVVSLPASTSSSQYPTSCSSVSGAPSMRPRISSLTRSSVRSPRRVSISCVK